MNISRYGDAWASATQARYHHRCFDVLAFTSICAETMPLRVLMIAPSMSIVGGHSIQANRIIRAFATDPEVRIRLHRIDAPIPGFIRRLPFVRTAANALVYYAGLMREVSRADVVHAFTSSFWGYSLWVIPAVRLARLFGRKIIVNYHDGRAEQHLREWPSAIRTIREADAIVVPSQYLVEVFARFGLEAVAIPNAINIEAFPWRERQVIRPEFLTNRGFEELYDVECTLRTFRIVQDHYPEARFTVANDGPLRRQMEALAAELGLHATFTGAVTQDRMAELYNAADIYVMSPKIDNMPLTIIECFACGLPVVSRSTGGVPFIARNEWSALLAPQDSSPEELAEACLRLLREPGLGQRLAAEGRRDCVERYGVNSVRDMWRRLYMSLHAT